MSFPSERSFLLPPGSNNGGCSPTSTPLCDIDVYGTVHRVYNEIQRYVDVPLSDEQMRSPEIVFNIIQPLEASLAESNDPSIVYVLLLNRLQFLRERDSTLASSSLNETRAHLCELLAIKLLRHQATAAKGGSAGLLAMSRAVVGGFHAFQGASEEVLERIKTKEGYASRVMAEAGGGETNALELAILGKARGFIKSQATQRVITAIWEGRVVYSSSSFIDILPDRWKVQQIGLYDLKKAPILDHYRLRVPKYRAIIDTFTFVVLFVSFLAVIIDHHKRPEDAQVSDLSPHEAWFFFFALGHSLDKLASIAEHGWSVYAAGLTNGLDLLCVPIFAISFALRIKSVWENDEWALEQAFAVLSCAACLMFPRLAFAAISNNVLILSLRAMLADFAWLMGIAVFCFLGFVFALSHLSDGAYSVARISEWLVFIWFGLDGSGIDKSPKFHPILGPILFCAYAALSNTLLVSLLVAILSGTYANIAADAAAEDMFRKAVLTFEGVKSDSLFDYFPPLNILALGVMWPISHFTSPRWFHKINVATCRVLSCPVLLAIALYERQSSPNAPIRSWLADVRIQLTSALPTKWTQKLALLEGAHHELEQVFEYTPSGDEEESDEDDDSMLSEDEAQDLLDIEGSRPRISSRASKIIAAPSRSAAASPLPAYNNSQPATSPPPLGLASPMLKPEPETASVAGIAFPQPISPSKAPAPERERLSAPSSPTGRHARFAPGSSEPRHRARGHRERLPSNVSGGYGGLGLTRTSTRSPDRIDSALSTSLPSASARFESPLAKLYQHHESDGEIGGGLRRRLSITHRSQTLPPASMLSMTSSSPVSTGPTPGEGVPSGSSEGAASAQSSEIKELTKLVLALQMSLARVEKKLEEKEQKEKEEEEI